MRWLSFLLSLIVGGAAVCPAKAQPTGQRFVSIAFHDVADRVDELDTDGVTTRTLTQFFDWLKGSGWTAVSLDDLAAAARGTRPLPDKAILLTFDDGYRSLYSRVFPLLQVYRLPVVAALVGSWMEGRSDGAVLYGDRVVPRSRFLSWSEAREMQASGLVEFASHSYGLHRGVLANPQGNSIPAAITLRYDPATGRYETDAQYRNRIRSDLQRSRQQITSQLGRSPRAIVWPFGRYSGPALAEAKAVGFTFGLTLEPEPAYTSDLYAIHRYFPSLNPNLGDLARNLRFDSDYPATRRVACLTLDALAAAAPAPGAAQDAALGAMIEGIRALGANIVIIDAHAGPLQPGAPLGAVYFPTTRLPMRADLLSRATWQMRTRGGADVFLHLPIDAAAAAVGEANVPSLFADMTHHVAADGLLIDATVVGRQVLADRPADIRARRAVLDVAALNAPARRALLAYRGAAAIDPRLRLMLPSTAGPADWADMALLGQQVDASATAALAQRLRSEGWLRPDVAGRVALSLPADQRFQVEAIRQSQRLGVSAFALCPRPPALPPSPALASAFSSATYPYRP